MNYWWASALLGQRIASEDIAEQRVGEIKWARIIGMVTIL